MNLVLKEQSAALAGYIMFVCVFYLCFLTDVNSAFANWNLDKLKRDLNPTAAPCRAFSDPSLQHPISNKERDLHHKDAWRCYAQTVRTGVDGLDFDLNFLEFDVDGNFRLPAQFDRLKAQLKTGNHLVVVYVHGWRHDAGRDDRDVTKFRTMLTYSAQFLKQRQKTGRFPNTKVTGIYIGWSGRSRFDCKLPVCNVLVAPSLFSRKPRSDDLGKPVVEALLELEKTLKKRPGGHTNKMLVTGHSLGGNMLIQGLNQKNIPERAIKDHKRGRQFQPFLGDLTVLFNPASESTNWVTIQEAVRSKMGLTDPNERYGFTNGKAIRNHTYFPFSQKPVLMSLTSACKWPKWLTDHPDNKDLEFRKIDCDTATGRLFKIFRAATFDNEKMEKTAIGHLVPSDACVEFDASKPKNKRCSRPEGHTLFSYGATHEVEVQVEGDDKTKRETTYQHALKDLTSTCEPGNAWLTSSKTVIKPNSPNFVGWDTGFKGNSSNELHKARAWVNKALELNIQYRHQLFRGFGRNGRVASYNITVAHDPFWNIRALDTAVKAHGGFYSYPLWCSIHQILLDEVTR